MAFNFYQSAEETWPFLKFNLDFQRKYKKSIITRGEYLLTKPSIVVFIKDQATSEEINALINKIKSSEYVSKAELITKEQALEIYRENNKDNTQLLELVTASMLPASIEVYLNNWEKQNEVAPLIEGDPIVEEAILTNLR